MHRLRQPRHGARIAVALHVPLRLLLFGVIVRIVQILAVSTKNNLQINDLRNS